METSLRRSNRIKRLPSCLGSYVAFESLLVPTEDIYLGIIDPITFASTSPDELCYQQAMKAPDAKQFAHACVEEFKAHHENGHWAVVPRSKIPSGTKIVPSVWAMKRKRRIATREIYKWKARLNVHGGKQEYGVHYWETYIPVVQWTYIRMFLILSILQNCHTCQLDFILAYPQANTETEKYMDMPVGFDVEGKSNMSHALILIKNIYGGKASGRIWTNHLKKGLLSIGFVKSRVDPCVFYRGNIIFLNYVGRPLSKS